MRPRTPALRAWLALPITALLACNGGGGPDASVPLTSDAPYLTHIAMGSVRNITVTSRGAQTQASEPASCTLEANLFDAPAMQDLAATATSGECTLYASPATLPLAGEHWICAGAVSADYAGQSQHVALCPSMGAAANPIVTIPCAGLDPAATVHISSGDELPPTDVVTDLDTTLAFPGAITFSQPSALGITTWPVMGDLPVQWASSGATSALVQLQVRGATTGSSTILCRPHTNGTVTVSATLIDQGNFRHQDVMVRVFSYHDVTTTAEMAHTYRVWAGIESAVLLQARL